MDSNSGIIGSEVSIDFHKTFNGSYSVRFYFGDSYVTWEFSQLAYKCFSPLAYCYRVDSFVPSYGSLSLHQDDFDSDVFFVDFPTVFGYLSSRSMWLNTGTHHTRVGFILSKLFEF